MIKNRLMMLEICKEFLPDTNLFAETPNRTVIKYDSEVLAIACGIYDKYFSAEVLASHENNKHSGNSLSFLHSLKTTTNQNIPVEPTGNDIWIFGYGSLMWKADFPFIDRKKGFICGYQRRFYQNSIDHRGTHKRPGRVVTLLPTGLPEDRVYGVAYRIASRHKEEVLTHLDYREKNGYERRTLEFQEFPEEMCRRFDIIMYIATPDNESYAGTVNQLGKIAEQIFCSAGPSGPNREYLFHLANTMRTLFPGVHDGHLFELEEEVHQRIKKDEVIFLERAMKTEIIQMVKKSLELNDEKEAKRQFSENLNKLKVKINEQSWKEELLTKEIMLSDNV